VVLLLNISQFRDVVVSAQDCLDLLALFDLMRGAKQCPTAIVFP
jgi:hypothetical protein